MGDGGVACVSSQHIMDRFSVCGGNNTNDNGNGSSTTTNTTNSKVSSTRKIGKMKKKIIKKVKKVRVKRDGLSFKSSVNSVKEGLVNSSSNNTDADVNKDEVEEGELGTLPIENGEFIVERPPTTARKYELKSEIEKGEIVEDRWRNGGGNVEKDESYSSAKWRKPDAVERNGYSSRSWRMSSKEELDKAEYLPERRRKSEVVRDDYGYSRARKHDSAKDNGRKEDGEWTQPLSHPPLSSSGKYSSAKELNRTGKPLKKSFSRYEGNVLEKTPRLNSKIVDEWNELSNGKNHYREHAVANRLKRQGADADTSDWRRRGDPDDYTSSKSRKVFDNSAHTSHSSEHYTSRATERFRNASLSKNVSSDRFSSRHFKSFSKVTHDKCNDSPRHSERSPHDRARNHDHRDRSPVSYERSLYGRSSHYDHRKSPNEPTHGYGYSRSPHDRGHAYDRSRSPYEHSRYVDNRKGSPSGPGRSPEDQSQYRDRGPQIPSFLEQSPAHGRVQDTYRRREVGEKKQILGGGSREPEGKSKLQKDPSERDLRTSDKDSDCRSKSDGNDSRSENVDAIFKEAKSPELDANTGDQKQEDPQENGSTVELASMEEDMDICNTPPHDPVLADAIPAKWFYLDHIGEEQGPSRLVDLKKLVEQGFLMSDHLIKHSDSDRWVTVENAVSPLVSMSFASIFPDNVTQLVSPPEAPGNLLADNGDLSDSCQPISVSFDSTSYHDSCLAASETPKDSCIEERVGALLEGISLVPGKELEIIGEALQMTFVNVDWEKCGICEGHQRHLAAFHDQISCEATSDSLPEGDTEMNSSILDPSETDIGLNHEGDRWFSGLWSCKGGDWKRNDEALLDRPVKMKVVLNDGYPLCQMQNCGHEDPRWHQKDELYYPLHGRKLDLPCWAFTSPDEWNEASSASKSTLSKFNNVRGVRGMMLPVIRINACVVKDQESFGSEQRVKAKGKERYSSRSSRKYSVSGDMKRSSEEGSRPRSTHEHDSRDSWKSPICTSFNVPKDHICTVDELKLNLGDWYYSDGAGHERGPLSFSEFQGLAEQGEIPKNSSIFRKVDKIWIPVFSSKEVPIPGGRSQPAENDSSDGISGRSIAGVDNNVLKCKNGVSGTFHNLHPQFIGYTRGRLHELVMKSYKSREFAAAINEVLDPWINTRIPKKEMEKFMYGSALFPKSDQFRASKRLRIDENEAEYEMDGLLGSAVGDCSFDELCTDAVFGKESGAAPNMEAENWDQLDGCVLGRVFHFLRADIRSLVNVTLTCKLWRYVVSCYKSASRQVDLSSLGLTCSDTIMWNIVNGYDREKICSLVLRGCTSITSGMLENVLKSFLNLSIIDIRGCSQFEELAGRFPNINWIRNYGSESKIRSAKHLSDEQLDDSSGLRDYLENADRRDSAKRLFRQSLYKRSKLFDARKSSSILSRDANLNRFTLRKSNMAYKRMEEFLDLSLKDIMKENTFEFFVPKVAKIENRMRNGYYAARGLISVKEDIIRMCRDAIRKKNRNDVTGINRIVTLFIHLANDLEGSSKSSYDRDEIMKTWNDDSPPGFSSISSKQKKNFTKANDKRSLLRSNGSSKFGDYVSDREIKRCLSKLNKKLVDSGSETSDNLDRSSDEGVSDSESTDSSTGSDSDLRSEGGIGESRVLSPDEGTDSFADEREWGARMTKASLVPPVTRKYEVIDHYVVVADEEEVRKKMHVSLPEDYAEKLNAQKSGIDESDMQIPEVKDYKPRKSLGVEVIEQEVYGIDPYTHNLLLDSMPEESDWSSLDKHVFIEDVLLRTINKQVRSFTGSGNTPMTYPLKPVFEEILETAEENNDWRTVKLAEYTLKAIDSRPGDNYVAYRKGLGVVCNKEGGFSDDDFVVEFLGEVYPTWKWFEKQDGIRALQKNSKDPAPEFYNIYLERPKGDADGYDLVVVDAMHKANYASRICHSCRPNCEAKVTAVDGQYQIGIYSVRPIQYGEEITFDYNSVTESKEEYEASVCLCGSHVCRGSFLNLTGEGAFLKVLKEYHGILDRHRLILEACELNLVSDEDYIDLLKAGLGSCLLDGLPDWLIAYSARLVRFINFERTKLPKEILRHNLEEKKKYFTDISLEVEKSDAEVQAEGVYNQRLQNLALTLDKVRYVMRCIFEDPKKAPPPVERLCPQEAASYVWSGEGSLVGELIQNIAPHVEDGLLSELQAKIRDHDPSGADNIEMELQKSLIWLRDELRNLPCTYKCRNDAAADLIHIYAHTKSFFRIREYKPVTSPPVYISPLDLCPKYADKLGAGGHEYCKTYGENYCLGQLMYWYNQANAEPDGNLARASRGCLSLPDIGSFYAKVQQPSRERVYGPRTVKFLLSRMEKQPQRPWPKDRIWSFKASPKIVGSPMLDAVLNKAPLDKEMLHWLKHRIPVFQAKWDR